MQKRLDLSSTSLNVWFFFTASSQSHIFSKDCICPIFFTKFGARRKGWSHCTSHPLPCVATALPAPVSSWLAVASRVQPAHADLALGESAALSPPLPLDMPLSLRRILKLSQLAYWGKEVIWHNEKTHALSDVTLNNRNQRPYLGTSMPASRRR